MMKKTLLLFPLLTMLFVCNAQQDCCPVGPQKNFGTKSEEPPTSQQRLQSDLFIDLARTSVTDQQEYFLLKTVVATINDDDAQFVELIVNLPVEIEFSTFEGRLQSSTEQQKLDCQQCGHVIKCKLDRLPKSSTLPNADNKEIFFTAKIGKPRFDTVIPTIGVTAISHFPADPDPSNNTFYWIAGNTP